MRVITALKAFEGLRLYPTSSIILFTASGLVVFWYFQFCYDLHFTVSFVYPIITVYPFILCHTCALFLFPCQARWYPPSAAELLLFFGGVGVS